MSSGWIKLHRGLLDWEWYDDINTRCLFIHCLLRANHADKTWRGITIKRGSFFTSLDTLAKETGLSASQLRTALKKLNSTSEMTSKGQATGRMISISNYDLYQGDDKQLSKPVTSQSQASDKPVTTNKNDKNENKEDINFVFDQYNRIVKELKPNWMKCSSVTDPRRKAIKRAMNQCSERAKELGTDESKYLVDLLGAMAEDTEFFSGHPNNTSKGFNCSFDTNFRQERISQAIDKFSGE